MSHLVFWQTVGVVYIGNALFALSLYMVWRINKEQRGEMGRAAPWVFFVGILGPAAVAFAAWALPH